MSSTKKENSRRKKNSGTPRLDMVAKNLQKEVGGLRNSAKNAIEKKLTPRNEKASPRTATARPVAIFNIAEYSSDSEMNDNVLYLTGIQEGCIAYKSKKAEGEIVSGEICNNDIGLVISSATTLASLKESALILGKIMEFAKERGLFNTHHTNDILAQIHQSPELQKIVADGALANQNPVEQDRITPFISPSSANPEVPKNKKKKGSIPNLGLFNKKGSGSQSAKQKSITGTETPNKPQEGLTADPVVETPNPVAEQSESPAVLPPFPVSTVTNPSGPPSDLPPPLPLVTQEAIKELVVINSNAVLTVCDSLNDLPLPPPPMTSSPVGVIDLSLPKDSSPPFISVTEETTEEKIKHKQELNSPPQLVLREEDVANCWPPFQSSKPEPSYNFYADTALANAKTEADRIQLLISLSDDEKKQVNEVMKQNRERMLTPELRNKLESTFNGKEGGRGSLFNNPLIKGSIKSEDGATGVDKGPEVEATALERKRVQGNQPTQEKPSLPTISAAASLDPYFSVKAIDSFLAVGDALCALIIAAGITAIIIGTLGFAGVAAITAAGIAGTIAMATVYSGAAATVLGVAAAAGIRFFSSKCMPDNTSDDPALLGSSENEITRTMLG